MVAPSQHPSGAQQVSYTTERQKKVTGDGAPCAKHVEAMKGEKRTSKNEKVRSISVRNDLFAVETFLPQPKLHPLPPGFCILHVVVYTVTLGLSVITWVAKRCPFSPIPDTLLKTLAPP